ncbi:UNVERIFIED_ORG: TRAP-type C4-dicarboxylate transport system permease small subunit [Martelella mediterranea]
MKTIRNYLLGGIEAVIAACLAVMLVTVFLNVVLRYAFNSGITLTEELSRLLFVWVVFLGAAAALFERAHLGVNTVILMMPRSARVVCFVLANLLMLWASWLVLSGTWRQAEINLGTLTPVLGVSQSLYFLPVIIFMIISLGWFSFAVLRVLVGRVSDDELAGMSASEEADAEREMQP